MSKNTTSTRLTASVDVTSEVLGISRQLGFQAVKRDEIPVLPIGKRLIVVVPKLEERLGRQISRDEWERAENRVRARKERQTLKAAAKIKGQKR